MRKLIAVFSIFALLSTGYAVEYNISDNYKLNKEPRDFEISEGSVFILLQKEIKDLKNPKIRYKTRYQLSSEFDFSKNLLVTGTRLGKGKIVTIDRESGKIANIPLDFWAGSVSLFKEQNKTKLIGSAVRDSSIFWKNGTKISDLGKSRRAKHFSEKAIDVDGDGRKEFLVEAHGARFGKIYMISSSNSVDWESQKYQTNWPKADFNRDYTTISTETALETRNSSSGKLLWSVEKPVDNFLLKNNTVYLIQNKSLIARQASTGKLIFSRKFSKEIKYLDFAKKQRKLVLSDGKSVFLFERNTTQDIYQSDKPIRKIKTGNIDSKGFEEIGLELDNSITILKRLKKQENVSAASKSFYGSSNNLLKFIAENTTVFVSDSKKDFEPFADNLTSIEGKVLETGKRKYLVENRSRGVYIAAIAAKNNASLTFEPGKADRSFSNYSLQDLQKRFIELYEPNHVAEVDLDSDMGLLSAQMAVKQGVMPAQNASRGLEMIGVNRKVVAEGRYISLLGSEGFYRNDTSFLGNERHLNDIQRGDIDGDGFIEAGVGRYPDDSGTASVMFHQSLERDEGERAVAVSEYIHENWAGVLASAGGGMLHGKRISATFEDQVYITERLVEHRVDVPEFLISLTPSSLQVFLTRIEELQDNLARVISRNAARVISDLLSFVKALTYAEQGLEIYLEHDWSTYGLDLDRATERLDEISIPKDQDLRTVIEKTIMKAIYVSVFPEKHTSLGQEHLESSLRTADVVFYSGRSNRTSWILPNNGSDFSSYYTGKENLNQVPELRDPLVFDSSDHAGSPENVLRTGFLSAGSPAFIGFSSGSYSPYNMEIARNFFRRGKTSGDSAKTAVNMFRESSGLLDSFESRETMEKSLVLWGNPETIKDPVEKVSKNFNSSCRGRLCRGTVETDLSNIKPAGTLLAPGEPTIPYYRFAGSSRNTEIINRSISIESRNGGSDAPAIEVFNSEAQKVEGSEREQFPSSKVSFSTSESLKVLVAGLYREGEVLRNISSVDITFWYREPVSVNIGREMTAIRSDEGFEATIVVDNRSGTTIRKLGLDAGLNKLNISPYSIRVYRSDQLVAEDRFRRLETTVFSRNTSEGYPGELMLIAENPYNTTITRSFGPRTGPGLVLSLGEQREKTVRLEPGEIRKLRWTVVGFEHANSSVSLAGTELPFHVSRARSISTSISPKRIIQNINGVSNSIDYSSNATHRKLVWVSGNSRIKITESYRGTSYLVESPGLNGRKIETSSRKVIELNSYRSVKENGKVSRRGDVNMKDLEKFRDMVSKGGKVFKRMKAES